MVTRGAPAPERILLSSVNDRETAVVVNRPKALPRTVWAVAWVSFFADVSTEMIYGLLPAYYLGTLSLSVLALGMIEGVAETIVSLTKLFSGYFSDRTGSRKTWMVVGYGLSAAAKPLMVLAASPWALGALRAGDRFGKGIRGAPRDALVAGVLDPRERGRAFGVQRGMDHAGALLGGLLAAALLAAGLAAAEDMFLLAAIPGAISVVIIIFFVREPREAASLLATKPRFSLSRAWRESDPALRRYLFAAAVFALASASDILLLALCFERFRDSGMSDAAAMGALPFLWAVLHIVRALGAPLGGRLSDRVGRLPLLASAWLMCAGVYAGAALFATGGHPAWSLLLFAAYGLVAALKEAPERALIADLQPEQGRRGTAYGMLHFVKGVLTLPATALAALIWTKAGAAWAFGTDALLALAAVGALFLFVPRRPQPLRIA